MKISEESTDNVLERLAYQEFCEVVETYFSKKESFEEAKRLVDTSKEAFYSDMGFYFDKLGIDSKITISLDDRRDVTIRKICKSKVTFDPDKTEKALGKAYSKEVINKTCSIADLDGLITYLKSCGVDPKIFKSFLSVKKEVDIEKLERLEELGKVSEDQLRGCFEVKNQKPYYTVSLSKGQHDED